jgi:membrane protease subunit (stomatin/prohibitin family)
MPELYIENISLPPEVEKVLDQRTSMGIAGDLNKYTQFAAAQAMQKAAEQGESGMGTGIGMGMGMGMGQAMAQGMAGMGQQPAAAPQAAPPPPPPAETQWHLAEGGQTKAPSAPARSSR